MIKAISKELLIEKQESLWPGLNGQIYHEYVIHVLYPFMKNALRQVCESMHQYFMVFCTDNDVYKGNQESQFHCLLNKLETASLVL